jgi:Septum formation
MGKHRPWYATALAMGLVIAACTSTSEEPGPTLPEVIPTLTPTTETTAEEPTAAPEQTAPEDAYRWAVGDCVDVGDGELPYAPYGTDLLIDCAEPHTHEVYYTATIPEGPDAPFPEDLDIELWDTCYFEFAQAMGYSVTDSTLDLTLYLPDEDEWAAGERYHACVVHQPGTTADFALLVGSTQDDPTLYAWEPAAGTCYDVLDAALLALVDPVDCAGLHLYQAIGGAVLGAEDAAYPGVETVAQLARDECDAVLAEYASAPLDDLPVLTFAVPQVVFEGDWDAGKRSVRCFAFAGSAEQGLLVMKGSLTDDTFEVVDELPEEGQTA